eukprot:GHVN01015593.1.p1 GENE.GHVN01015593.1~~GHVN01015593.1.p1  ORF type:complete len:535 (+),score=99.42 GHVN01015593.1:59-1663(+)
MSRVCCELVANDGSKRVVCVLPAGDFDSLKKAACDKLRASNGKVRLFYDTGSELTVANYNTLRRANSEVIVEGESSEPAGDSCGEHVVVIVCGKGEELNARWKHQKNTGRKRVEILGMSDGAVSGEIMAQERAVIRYTHHVSYVDDEALGQVEAASNLPFMRVCVGMADLHPGRGGAIGCAYGALGVIYPHLIGDDIGCGMTFFKTGIRSKGNDLKRCSRWAERLNLDSPSQENEASAFLKACGMKVSMSGKNRHHHTSLGTIGGGNHFAELQKVESIVDEKICNEIGISESSLYLLIHSGSRGLGKSVLDDHIETVGYECNGLKEGSQEAEDYMQKHNYCCQWARANRELIAYRFIKSLRSEDDETGDEASKLTQIIDLWHNAVVKRDFIPEEAGVMAAGVPLHLHRKGAAPSDVGYVVIPGSRGAFSYIISPSSSQAVQQRGGYSLPHGAGRKWRRDKARKKGQAEGGCKQLLTTALGSHVVCEDKSLLYEETPQAYKEIEGIIEDVKIEGLGEVIAVMRPLLTYKTRSSGS